MLAPNTLLQNRYLIVRLLAQGGMGAVYEAKDQRLGSTVALKETHFDDDALRKAFEREARLLANLRHPALPKVSDHFTENQGQFLVMEFVPGEDLGKILKLKGNAFTLDEVLNWADQLLGALDYLHAQQPPILHRDIKPQNFKLTPQGQIILLDFGLAKGSAAGMTHQGGSIFGFTPHYASLEQMQGAGTDARSDLYSLAATLYHLLTNQTPPDALTRANAVLNGQPDPLRPANEVLPLVPQAVAAVLQQAMALKRDERPDTAAILRRLLNDATRRFQHTTSTDDSTVTLPVESASREKLKERTIAVLPFKVLSTGDQDNYLGLGMADALITRLGNIREVIVRPTSAVSRFAGTDQNLAAVGRELKVDSVLEGSIRRAGERVRVTVQLVNIKTEAPLWADKFDESFTDIFEVEDSISEKVVEALMVNLRKEEKALLKKRYTENAEAYQAYLKGRFHWNKRTESGLLKSIEYFQQAIEIDPTYALAYSGLADSHITLVFYGSVPPHPASSKAKAAVLKALEIDDSLAEAHTSLAHIKGSFDWDWPGAEKEYRRAIELSPNYATAHHWYGMFLINHRRFDEALAEVKRAQEIDPLSLAINMAIGDVCFHAGKYEQAIEQWRKALEIAPDFSNAYAMSGRAYEQMGLDAKAIEMYLKGEVLWGESPEKIAGLRKACDSLGVRGYWQKRLEMHVEKSKQEYVSPSAIAQCYARLDEPDQAMKWLEKSYEERCPHLIFLNSDPEFDSLRSDPRFIDLLKRIGLPPGNA